MSREFIPPQVISTEHLSIRPFVNAAEALKYDADNAARISQKDAIGYYVENSSPFKEYAIFLRDTDILIGMVDFLVGVRTLPSGEEVAYSTYMRNIHHDHRGSGLGAEIVRGIIENLVAPAIDKMVFTEPFYLDGEGKYVQTDVKLVQFYGNNTIVDIDNYPSIFSNISAGMPINGIIGAPCNKVIMTYPSEAYAPNADLIKTMFKAIISYDKTPSLELQNALKEILINVILSTNEPHTVVAAAHILLDKCKDIDITPELRDKLHATYEILELSQEDNSAYLQFYADNYEVHYDASDSLYKEIMCAGEVSHD